MKNLARVIMMLTLLSATPLQANEFGDAICEGDKSKVELLINKGANINETETQFEVFPLMKALMCKKQEIASLLIRKGANVHSSYIEKQFRTGKDVRVEAIVIAATMGYVDIVETLLSKGADVNSVNEYGWTPLHAAAATNNIEMAKLLIAKGAKKNVISLEGETPVNVINSAVLNKLDDTQMLKLLQSK